MKITIVTVAIGYLLFYFLPEIDSRLILLGTIIYFTVFTSYIVYPRIKGLPSFYERLTAIFGIIIFVSFTSLLFWALIVNEIIKSIYIPLIIGGIVLSRHIIRLIVTSSIKEPKGYGVQSITDRGETVRSKAEKTVADWFYHNNYDFIYEKKLEFRNGDTLLYDFYLPDHEIYVEYWGLSATNNPTGEQYRERKNEKIEIYEKHNLKLMSLYPHHLFELDKEIPRQIHELNQTRIGFWARVVLFLRSAFGNQDKQEKVFCTSCGQMVIRTLSKCDACGELLEI